MDDVVVWIDSIRRVGERVCHEPESVDEVALARAVRAHKEGEAPELGVTRSDALVTLDPNAREEGCSCHGANAVSMCAETSEGKRTMWRVYAGELLPRSSPPEGVAEPEEIREISEVPPAP